MSRSRPKREMRESVDLLGRYAHTKPSSSKENRNVHTAEHRNHSN